MPAMARSKPQLIALQGTQVRRLPGEKVTRAKPSDRRLTISLHLRSKTAEAAALERVVAVIADGKRPPMTREEFAARFGASPDDIKLVRQFARRHGFRVSSVSVAKRMLHLTGGTDDLARAFGVKRTHSRLGDDEWDSYSGSLHLPAELKGAVNGVYGFDFRPEAERGDADASGAPPTVHHSFSSREIADLYGFPGRRDGRGVSVGVIALGGGYLDSDMRHFFESQHLPVPRVRAIPVCGAQNAPYGDSKEFDGEVTGDIQTLGAIAPRTRIAVYFAPNTSRGFLEAVCSAVHDAKENISVLSISWGQAEVHWRRRTVEHFNRMLLEAAALGITVCCASGDHGSFADTRDRKPHVCFPGSSPWALACGGTTLVASKGKIVSEKVWHNATGASGGGVSVIFPRPDWQKHSRVPKNASGRRGRGVPDVASHADPLHGYRFYCLGKWRVGAGTSASAPVWAGLFARLNQGRRHPIGLVTPHLYKHFPALVRRGAMAPVTKGSNGLFRARKGWRCCTGLGSPRGERLGRELDRRVRGHLALRFEHLAREDVVHLRVVAERREVGGANQLFLAALQRLADRFLHRRHAEILLAGAVARDRQDDGVRAALADELHGAGRRLEDRIAQRRRRLLQRRDRNEAKIAAALGGFGVLGIVSGQITERRAALELLHQHLRLGRRFLRRRRIVSGAVGALRFAHGRDDDLRDVDGVFLAVERRLVGLIERGDVRVGDADLVRDFLVDDFLREQVAAQVLAHVGGGQVAALQLRLERFLGNVLLRIEVGGIELGVRQLDLQRLRLVEQQLLHDQVVEHVQLGRCRLFV
jgi:kumamolisin